MEPGTDLELVAQMERMLLATFPPLEIAHHDGITVGSAHGATGRSNSAVVTGTVTDLPGSVAWANSWLAERGRTPLFRLSPIAPTELADLLGRDNAYNTTSCLHRRFASSTASAVEQAVDPRVEFATARPADWVSERDTAGQAEVAALMENVAGQVAWALIRDDERTVAAGRGVLVDGWLCVQAMYTVPHERGRGHANRILSALHQWAHNNGATDAFLNVLATNHAAKSIYAAHDYAHAYDYTYVGGAGATRSC